MRILDHFQWLSLPILVFVLMVASSAQQKPSADLIVTNAKVWTVDKSHPQAEAVAVIGERIVAVGSSADIANWRGPGTKVIDAGGKLVLPGFNDAHVHFIEGSAQLFQVDLKDAKSPQEFAHRIAAQVKKTPKGDWILGGNWDDQAFEHPELPTHQLIDAITPDNPVWVTRYDGHMSLANALALKLAGVDKNTKDVPGGVIRFGVRRAGGHSLGAAGLRGGCALSTPRTWVFRR